MPTPAQRIIWAVRTRKHSRLRELLQRPGYLTVASPAGRTALHAAAETGDWQAVQWLIDAGADVNARMQSGETPLHRAAAYGRGWDLADRDLDRRDPLRGNSGRPFSQAVAEAFLAVLKERNPEIPHDLGLRDDLSQEVKPDAMLAAWECYAKPAELLRELEQRGIDLDREDPVLADNLRGRLRYMKVASLLLDHGADVNALADGCRYGIQVSVLRQAAEHGSASMLKLLLERGASFSLPSLPPDEGDQLMRDALERTAVDVAEVLIQHGVQFREKQTRLTEAAGCSWVTVINWLLDHGADVNLPNEYGTAPLIAAGGHYAAMACLLSRGAIPTVRDQDGNGLLHQSAPWPKCLEVVLPLGLPLEQANAKGRTSLHCAAQSGSHEGAQLLLQAGACVNAQDHDGNTAIHLIFDSDEFRPDIEFPVFLALVEAGADLTLRNRAGQTAHDLATRWSYPAEYLRLLHPDGTGARPGTFLWLGSDPGLREFLPRAEIPIQIDGKRFPSSQAWFEARKLEVLQQRLSWAAHCDATMLEALRQKFLQHSVLSKRLLATGDAQLIADSAVEGCWGGYWTERQGTPFNALGHMLMKVREELQLGLSAS